MANLKLEINQSVELYVKSGLYAGEEYISQVTQITDDEIQIALPIEREQLVTLPVGTHLEVLYTDQSAQYKFNTKIVSRKMDNNIGVCNLKKPDKIDKIQRRDFVRVPIKITVEYRQLILDEVGNKVGSSGILEYDESQQKEFKEAPTKNISGGGVLLIVEEDISLDSFVELKLDVENLSFETVIGVVVRVDEIPESENKLGLGIKFVNISQKKQDEIVQWVLQKQLELHRKGLL